MRAVTVADLRAIAAGKAPLASKLVGPINKHAAANGITTPLRMCHFLAHMAHETTGFSTMIENLNYTTPGRLMEVWPSRFKTRADEKPFLKNPQALANKVYNGRLGNRVGSNDGWDYRGSGPYQLTGRTNYQVFGDAAGVDLESNPELARDPDTGVEVAAKYFAARMAKAADRDDINGSTVALNGGTKGLADRKKCLARAKEIFGVGTTRVARLMQEPSVLEPTTEEREPAPPVVENIAFDDEATVKAVQAKLRELGYSEVGVADGNRGDFTRKAIVLYRGDKGLPYSDKIDSQLLVKLFSDTEKRKQPEGREDASPAAVRERVPEVAGNWKAKVTGWWTAGLSAVGAGLNAAWDYIGEAREKLDPVKELLGDVPTWFWLVAVAAGAFILSRQFSKAEQAGVEAFREGARR